MRRSLIAVLALAPFASFASTPCQFGAPRTLQANLAGVRAVQIDVHSHDLHLIGNDKVRGLGLAGRACASDKATLDALTVTQRRQGDQLLIDIGGSSHGGFALFGNSYASLEVTVQLPPTMPVTLSVGSGDADARHLQQLQATVGSGDLHVRSIFGKLGVSVGSGDVDANDVGSLELGSVGSGDVTAEGVRMEARIGSIGSGDVALRRVGGDVHADTLGSGDLSVSGVGGDFTLGAKGSGDVSHSGVKGKVSVPHDDD